MRLLLDTHVLLWWLSSPEKLSREVYKTIATPENEILVSAASAWEIAIKTKSGKLHPQYDLQAQIKRNRFTKLNITFSHVTLAGDLPTHHADPFDRVLVAQAICEALVLVTQDSKLSAYDVQLMMN